jgi:hypothetical protein
LDFVAASRRSWTQIQHLLEIVRRFELLLRSGTDPKAPCRTPEDHHGGDRRHAIDAESGALKPIGRYPIGKGANWVEILAFD